jgi:hypothetical protein
MNRLMKAMLGVNVASVGCLLQGGTKRFANACRASFNAAQRANESFFETIPPIPLAEILGGAVPEIRLLISPEEDGVLPQDQAVTLLSILVIEQPDVVLEIGTFMGRTTRLMAENLPRAVIHTVDLPLGYKQEADAVKDVPKDDFHLIGRRVVGRDFAAAACAGRIQQHLRDTAAWDFAEVGRPQFFFIDGSHTYEYCKNDTEKCLAISSGRGVFLWHDCDRSHPGVVRCLRELRATGKDVRVIQGTPIAYLKLV